ncbi:MAG: 16S rRNA (cytosine(1402)-N(4))-methyltransferase RsmH [Flavobacteriales bacterium]|nr:16S rRNA (cytosine(1402)-N(4))-methyltransferase RsmH [Flavobacteriales bacterium]
MSSYHVPVLLHESVDGLAVKPSGTYVDCTFGGGGHSALILSKLGPEGRLIVFDKDEDAKKNAPEDSRLYFVASDFRFIKNYLKFLKITQVDGILADLGVSSHQFDTPERGFSLRFESALDMRMDQNAAVSAGDIINTYEQEELARVLYEYGELNNSRRVAAQVVSARPIQDTVKLKEVLSPFLRRGEEHKFLAKFYQALRIEVNDEIAALKDLLHASLELLALGGRLSVISYHSLEDRLVKNFIRAGNFSGVPEKDFFGNPLVNMKAVNRQVIIPTEEEIKQNNRARSAKLRIAEKIG